MGSRKHLFLARMAHPGASIDEMVEIVSPGVRVADHFPSVLPACKEVAAEFFYCFSNRSKDSRMIPADGLMPCFNEMKIYDKCMIEELAKKNKK